MQYWSLSDPGCVRTQNQDAYQVEQLDRNTLLCVLCDGMGGAKSGNVASSLAVEVFTQEIKRTWFPSLDQISADQMLRGAAKLANFTVFDQSKQFEEFLGMGTTLVAALIRGRDATIINVGDSRMYMVDNKDRFVRVTRDHSLVEMMVSRGELTEEEARVHPKRNYITRAVGTAPEVEADLYKLPVGYAKMLLLCSDGLSSQIADERICEIIKTRSLSLTERVDMLVNEANRNGGTDNISIILIEMEGVEA